MRILLFAVLTHKNSDVPDDIGSLFLKLNSDNFPVFKNLLSTSKT